MAKPKKSAIEIELAQLMVEEMEFTISTLRADEDGLKAEMQADLEELHFKCGLRG